MTGSSTLASPRQRMEALAESLLGGDQEKTPREREPQKRKLSKVNG